MWQEHRANDLTYHRSHLVSPAQLDSDFPHRRLQVRQALNARRRRSIPAPPKDGLRGRTAGLSSGQLILRHRANLVRVRSGSSEGGRIDIRRTKCAHQRRRLGAQEGQRADEDVSRFDRSRRRWWRRCGRCWLKLERLDVSIRARRIDRSCSSRQGGSGRFARRVLILYRFLLQLREPTRLIDSGREADQLRAQQSR